MLFSRVSDLRGQAHESSWTHIHQCMAICPLGSFGITRHISLEMKNYPEMWKIVPGSQFMIKIAPSLIVKKGAQDVYKHSEQDQFIVCNLVFILVLYKDSRKLVWFNRNLEWFVVNRGWGMDLTLSLHWVFSFLLETYLASVEEKRQLNLPKCTFSLYFHVQLIWRTLKVISWQHIQINKRNTWIIFKQAFIVY